MSRRVLSKLKNVGSLTILIEIGGVNFGKPLCDHETSINLILLSTYRRLDLGDLKEALISLQLVDRSLVHLKGVLEDVLVEVR